MLSAGVPNRYESMHSSHGGIYYYNQLENPTVLVSDDGVEPFQGPTTDNTFDKEASYFGKNLVLWFFLMIRC